MKGAGVIDREQGSQIIGTEWGLHIMSRGHIDLHFNGNFRHM